MLIRFILYYFVCPVLFILRAKEVVHDYFLDEASPHCPRWFNFEITRCARFREIELKLGGSLLLVAFWAEETHGR